MHHWAKYLTWHYWKVKIKKLRWRRYRPKTRYAWPGAVFTGNTAITVMQDLGRLPVVRECPSPDQNGKDRNETFSYNLYGAEGKKRVITFTAKTSPPLTLVHVQNALCVRYVGIFTSEEHLLPSPQAKNPNGVLDNGPEPMRLHPHVITDVERWGIEEATRQCFYLDCDFSGAYGHFIVDVAPRLWAYPPGEALPGLTAFSPEHTYVEAMVRPFGMLPNHIRHFKRAIFCRDLYVASTAYTRGLIPHPEAVAVWDRIAKQYTAKHATPEKIFFSRRYFSVRRRSFKQEKEVEALFRSLGFHIVYPEELPFAEQIRLVRKSRLIAGTYGSALHNTIFSANKPRVFIVAPYANLNYPIIDCSAGRNFTYYLGNYEGHPVEVSDPHYRDDSWELSDWDDFVQSVRAWVNE